MNFRTLSKEETIHVINLSCMVLAWGVTSFYFDATTPSKVIGLIGELLLTPVTLLNKTIFNIFHVNFLPNAIGLFIPLWLTYFLIASRLSSLLRIKDHGTTELRNWYLSRKVS